ncbi:origin recognition complex subunit 1 [Condylostylus longicornis]|uniref:origin recognition complex subunit 1 n=1 Tax=Condylostylus longicornis TaxID=2530218 RepID=UPI00244E3B6B|nr:origin recognition complex subunit 1 [Condylostylus longicornis]
MGIASNEAPVLWMGNQVEPAANLVHNLKYKNIRSYKKCFFDSFTLNCGDFVLVSNADAKDQDSIRGCDVAEILLLYELDDKFSPLINEPFRAIVQWYSWPQTIPARHYDSDEIEIDFDKEVIEDHRPYDNDISIETIQGKCTIVKGNINESAAALIKMKSSKFRKFACRYKFVKKLLPLLECSETKLQAHKAESIKTSKSKKRSAVAICNLTYESDCSTASEPEYLNYSIINKNEINANNLNIKLRVSQRSRKSIADEEVIDENSVIYYPENKMNNKKDPLVIRQCKTIFESSPYENKVATRRKSILRTPNETNSRSGTPKRNIQLSNIVEERFYDKITQNSKTSCRSLEKAKSNPNATNNELTPVKRKKYIKISSLEATVSNRKDFNYNRKSDLQVLRENLHVSTVPECLPCRESEYENIYNFVEHKIVSETGGCMYISGVPGTGKTATVTRVISALKKKSANEEIPKFEFIEINGMRLTEPRQAYVQIYKQLVGKPLSWEQSQSLLEKRFTTPTPRRKTTVLLVDELDVLCNRRQDVVYNLLDWPSKTTAKLVVISIANTMDLPERLLIGKVTSRLGLTRLTFQPYTHKQLQEIVKSRLIEYDPFKSDALQLVARKVAAVSGDARRALDICRRATEIAEKQQTSQDTIVKMDHVQKALEEMISSAKVQAIKSCSKQEKIFLQAISAEVARTGLEEVIFKGVYTQIEAIAAFSGQKLPSISQVFKTCSKLGSQRLIICEHSRNDLYQKIILNICTDDIHFALQNNVV